MNKIIIMTIIIILYAQVVLSFRTQSNSYTIEGTIGSISSSNSNTQNEIQVITEPIIDSIKSISYSSLIGYLLSIQEHIPEIINTTENLTSTTVADRETKPVKFTIYASDDNPDTVGISLYDGETGLWTNYSGDFISNTTHTFVITREWVSGITYKWYYFANDTTRNINTTEIYSYEMITTPTYGGGGSAGGGGGGGGGGGAATIVIQEEKKKRKCSINITKEIVFDQNTAVKKLSLTNNENSSIIPLFSTNLGKYIEIKGIVNTLLPGQTLDLAVIKKRNPIQTVKGTITFYTDECISKNVTIVIEAETVNLLSNFSISKIKDKIIETVKEKMEESKKTTLTTISLKGKKLTIKPYMTIIASSIVTTILLVLWEGSIVIKMLAFFPLTTLLSLVMILLLKIL